MTPEEREAIKDDLRRNTRVEISSKPFAIMQEKCGTCKFWVLEHHSLPVATGQCRRLPPTVIGQAPVYTEIEGKIVRGRRDESLWPLTASDDWCGEWKEILESKGT